MTTNISLYIEVVVFVIVLVTVIFVTITLLRNYRHRRLATMRADASDPATANDRAYNRLALARREADLYEAQGGDVERARQLIDLSSHSLATREYDRAYDLAQAAHETLVIARKGPLKSRPPQRALTSEAVPATSPPPSPASASSAAPTPPSVPKNRAEAQFQLRLFEEDIVAAKKRSPAGATNEEAREAYVQAHAAFVRGDYAEAFRLALKGRRKVGGRVESLGPPAPGTATAPSEVSAPDPIATAEEVAGHDRCPSCGEPVVAGDAFCRGCGAAKTPLACPTCGGPRTPKDAFCGKCGTRYS